MPSVLSGGFFFFFFFFTTEPSRKPPGNLFFTEGWEIQDQAVVGLVASGSQLPGSEMAVFSLCSHTVDGEKELSGVLL